MTQPAQTPKPGEAFLADEAANPTPELDRLVDNAGFSYAEARQRLGNTVTPHAAQLITVPETSPREAARTQASEYYGTEFGLTGDWSELSEQQRAINAAGLAKVRKALDTTHNSK